MNKSYIYLLGLIALLAFSCTDDPVVKNSGNELRITGSFAADSRTTFVEGDGVIETHWNVGDEIGLFGPFNNLNCKANIGGRSTEFSYEDDDLSSLLIDLEGETVMAYYPYEYPYNFSEGSPYVMMSDTYYSHDGNVRPFLYSQAQICNGELNFQFKHLFSYLKIVVSAQNINKQFIECKKLFDHPMSGSLTTEGSYISITGSEGIVPNWQEFINLNTHEFLSGTHVKWIKFKYSDQVDLTSNNTYSFIIPILPQPEGVDLTAALVFLNEEANRDQSSYEYVKKVPQGGLQAGHVYVWNLDGNNQYEENVDLLKSFYEKTGGEQWFHNDNWLSSKPLNEWYGVNKDIYIPSTEIQSLALRYNNLTGPFPEEVAEIMDQLNFPEKELYYSGFDLNDNNLYGPIPDKVKNHQRWNELGWKCVVQNTTGENELDLTNSNLYIENVQVEDLFSDENIVRNLYDIFKENKLTQITGSDFTGEDMQLNSVIERFTDKRVNLHLDYQSKGLKTLFFLGEGTDSEVNECKEGIRRIYGNVDGITWIKGGNNNNYQYRSASYFYDSNGQLVYIAYHNPSCPWSEEDLLIGKTDKFLRSVFGEPEKHPEFSSEIYTSTDYSRNGEVITLQEATVGKGINLTFMGEAFVDKDMEPDGLYEQTMKKAMEQFFSFEPYKSLRNRFNVYAVKVVSPNSAFVEGAQHAINQDYSVCFDYAKRIPNGENSQPMVAVIYRDFTWFDNSGRSHCNMFGDGSFVAYVIQRLENDGTELMHEAGGHGFGQLLDEYVEHGYEMLTLPEEGKILMDEKWNQYGQGANVDWRNDASTIKWSHFLNDERYVNDGLGIYEGAFLYAYGAYRPSENSMMRYNDSPFNAPSREAIYKRIMKLSEGENWTYDYEEFVKFDEKNRNVASRSASRTLTEAEKQEYIKNHQPPTFIKGTWRDAIKNGKSNIVVPLR